MAEETVFETEEKLETQEISERLRRIAERLEEGVLELESGSQSVSLNPPGRAEFEVKVERDSSDGETSLELEIEWKDGEGVGLEIG